MEKKNLIIISIIAVLLIAFVGLNAKYSVIGDKPIVVNIPEYGSVYCDNCQASVQSKIINVATPSWNDYSYEVYDCLKSQSTGKEFYVGNEGCSYTLGPVDSNQVGETFIYICDISSNANNVISDGKISIGPLSDGLSYIPGCIKQEIGGSYSGKLAQNKYLHIISEVQVSGKIDYNALCLWTDVRGQINSYNTCDIRTLLGDEVKDVPSQYDNLGILTAGKTYAISNAVIGYSGLAQPRAVVKIPGTNEWVYLAYYNGEVKYYELNTAEDGSVYVDMSNPKTNKAFVCVPGVIDGCVDGIKLSQTECTNEGYIGEFTNLDTRCQKYCVAGKQVVKDCVAIVDPVVVVPVPEICNDKLDNDKNGLIDIKDPVCQSGKTPLSKTLILFLIIFLLVGAFIGWKITDVTGIDNIYAKSGIIIVSSIIIGLLLFLILKGVILFFQNLLTW